MLITGSNEHFGVKKHMHIYIYIYCIYVYVYCIYIYVYMFYWNHHLLSFQWFFSSTKTWLTHIMKARVVKIMKVFKTHINTSFSVGWTKPIWQMLSRTTIPMLSRTTIPTSHTMLIPTPWRSQNNLLAIRQPTPPKLTPGKKGFRGFSSRQR